MDEVKGRAAVRDSGESIEVVVVLKGNSGFGLLPWVVDEKGNRPLGARWAMEAAHPMTKLPAWRQLVR